LRPPRDKFITKTALKQKSVRTRYDHGFFQLFCKRKKISPADVGGRVKKKSFRPKIHNLGLKSPILKKIRGKIDMLSLTFAVACRNIATFCKILPLLVFAYEAVGS